MLFRDESARQTAIDVKKINEDFQPKGSSQIAIGAAGGDPPPRAVTVRSVNFIPEYIRSEAESMTSFKMGRLTTSLL